MSGVTRHPRLDRRTPPPPKGTGLVDFLIVLWLVATLGVVMGAYLGGWWR